MGCSQSKAAPGSDPTTPRPAGGEPLASEHVNVKREAGAHEGVIVEPLVAAGLQSSGASKSGNAAAAATATPTGTSPSTPARTTKEADSSSDDLASLPKPPSLKHIKSREDLLASFHRREAAAEHLKRQAASDWLPEYRPVSIVPPRAAAAQTFQKTTKISPAMILQDVPASRKTKIVCTMGPSCASADLLGKLVAAGMDLAHFDLTTGTLEEQQAAYVTLQQVCDSSSSIVATIATADAGNLEFVVNNKIDLVAVTAQSAKDVRLVQCALSSAGASSTKVVSRVGSTAALLAYDDILAASDGIMVARGDLAMEIPSEKVALAQKMMVTKANIAGKFIITQAKMLESMVDHPLPTRAEMTDAANAVFDGTDAVMLGRETAAGAFPEAAVATMAAITQQAELGVDYAAQFDFLRYHNTGRQVLSCAEATLAGVARCAIDFSLDRDGDGVIDLSEGCVALVLTATGQAAELVAKYRPSVPVIVASTSTSVLRQSCVRFGLHPLLVPSLEDLDHVLELAKAYIMDRQLGYEDRQVILVRGADGGCADSLPEVTVESIGRRVTRITETMDTAYRSPFEGNATLCAQTLRLGLDVITQPVFNTRSTKVIATVSPAIKGTQEVVELLKSGANVLRLDAAHDQNLDHLKHTLELCREACKQAAAIHSGGESSHAIMLSLRGPNVCVVLPLGEETLAVSAGQLLQLVSLTAEQAVQWPGSTGSAEVPQVGVELPNLCMQVAPGQVISMDDGDLKVEVVSVDLPQKLVVVKALNTHQLTHLTSLHLPGVRVQRALTTGPAVGVMRWAAANKVDFVSVPCITSAADLKVVRQLLDDADGPDVSIIAQVDTTEGIQNFDEILQDADGVMVCRGQLGVVIPPQKICLAQKWMVNKAHVVGKPVFIAHQLLSSMTLAAAPSLAEMTDVANAVLDGVDGIVLTAETEAGHHGPESVAQASKILTNAEVGIDHYAAFNWLRNFTPKPMSNTEAIASSAVKAAIDMNASLMAVVTNSLPAVRMLAKYRPPMAIVVVTTEARIARQASCIYGTMPLLLKEVAALPQLQQQIVSFARQSHLAEFVAGDLKGGQLVVVTGPSNRLFAKEEDLSELEFVTLLSDGAQEAAEVQAPQGYRGDDVIAYKTAKVGLDLICDRVKVPRKTKIVCTLGPACWSHEGLVGLLEGGMGVARFNFSHGSHADHQQVLDRVRAASAAAKVPVAMMLDTKGPEIRTAMLRDHKNIQLVKDQEITVVAVGDAYTTWEGYKDEATGETKIGVSYAQLCKDVKEGSRILFADGAMTIQVVKVLSDTEILGKVLNSKSLGERKNVNLPGVQVQLPVLTDKDVQDVQEFAVRNKMDYISASFVQSADDVRFIRKVLDDVGGQDIKIISKIESSHGLLNYDGILALSDGIMVARGDLAMEIPSEKVALAQKMMVTKANIAGKFIITATQMLESMVNNPLPTRAEMTDVANAVFDGTDAVMLSGETANGSFPQKAVATMAAIVANAEVGTNYYQQWEFIRDFSDRPMHTAEAVLGAAAKDALDVAAGLVVVVSRSGKAARLVAKYRPRVPVLVITDSEVVARQSGAVFALKPYLVPSLPASRYDVEFEVLLEEAAQYACTQGLCLYGDELVVVHGAQGPDADTNPMHCLRVAPGSSQPFVSTRGSRKTLSLRTTAISMSDMMVHTTLPRKTKIVCTMGPASNSEEGLEKLLDAGLDVARFNFSHGKHADHKQVLDRLRGVAGRKGRRIAYLLDTKGPEVRTAMLKGGADLELQKDEEVVLVAVGAAYETYEGGKDEATGVVRIGISYDKLCQSVKPGYMILMADGSLTIEVLQILNDTELRGRCLNHKVLGQRKNVNLPGVKVDIPVLTDKDVEDLQTFCAAYRMDYVAASFVQTAADVRFIRDTLDAAPGGQHVKIIAKIENEAGLAHFDDILALTDGIMVARGDLAMEIPSEKVALAQKMMVTKANIAGKFIITATQMLESMVSNPLPTRAEMTNVANAVFDGTDAVMLSGETANGSFPDTAVKTMAAIVQNAENANSYFSNALFIKDHSPKPLCRLEALSSSVAAAVTDANVSLVITLSSHGIAARMVSKYRPAVPQVVVTDKEHVANHAALQFGQYALVVPDMTKQPLDALVASGQAFAAEKGLWSGEGTYALLHGANVADADGAPVLRLVDTHPQLRRLDPSFSTKHWSMSV